MPEAAAACALLALPTLAERVDHLHGRDDVRRGGRDSPLRQERVKRDQNFYSCQPAHRHLVVLVKREVPQRYGGVLLLRRRAVPHKRHERLDAARARNRHLLVMGVCVRVVCGVGAHTLEMRRTEVVRNEMR